MKYLDFMNGKNSLWIFGYGSLVWKPDFKFKRSRVGCVHGYKRRFWHGDNFYRGNNDMPGRVVTLVEDNDACTWGVAYEVTGKQIEEAMLYLNMRESVQGGYISKLVEFFPRDTTHAPFLALVYIATADNPIYQGPASPEEIAAQIASCEGKTGHNVEYLLCLAQFMRHQCPEVEDQHLFSIEAAALTLMPDLRGSSKAAAAL